MDTATERVGFEHKGFNCTITERPDFCYLCMVHGHRKLDDKDFLPNVLFEQDMADEQIRDACIDIMDGTFSGKVERYGNYNVIVGV